MPGRPEVGGLDGSSALEPQTEAGSRRGRIDELVKPTAYRLIGPVPYSGAVAGRAVSGGALTSAPHLEFLAIGGAPKKAEGLEDANPNTSIPTNFPEFDFRHENPGM